MNTIQVLNVHGIDFLTNNNIDVKYILDKSVYILNYQQIETNKDSPYKKHHPVIRECRNLIVRKLPDNTWCIMSKSFERFFNYLEHKEETEIFIKAMENKEVIAKEKLDGSLIQVTYFDDKWHIFTRGSDADENLFRGLEIPTSLNETFGDRVRKYIVDFNLLNKDLIYIFELCTPLLHVTNYEKEKLALLAILDRKENYKELDHYIQVSIAKVYNWHVPEVFYPSSIEQVYYEISKKPKDFEGYVLCYNTLRMKVKSESYITLHHLGKTSSTNCNTLESLIKICVEGEIDETCSVLKKYTEQLKQIQTELYKQYDIIEKFYEENKNLSSKDYGLKVQELNSKFAWILFNLKNNKFSSKNIRCLWLNTPKEKGSIISKITTSMKRHLETVLN